MKLYHGTNYSSAISICSKGIDLECSQKYLDFGPGFYTTPSYEHAAITAIRKTDKFNRKNKLCEEPYIVELKYIPDSALNLNVVAFPRHCEAWGNFVLNNRLTADVLAEYNLLEHNQNTRYDICIGEIADGKIVNIAYQVNYGMLLPKKVKFSAFLKISGEGYPLQYSFHTEKSISCISELSCDIIKNKEKYLKQIRKE